jgi:hypothetical protein
MYENASNATILMLLHTAVYPFLAALIISIVAGRWLHASPYLGYLGGFIVGLSLIHSGLSFPPSQGNKRSSRAARLNILKSPMAVSNLGGLSLF